MHTTLTEKYSFVRSSLVVLVAIVLLTPALALAETHPLFNVQSTTQSPFPSDRFTAFDTQQLTGLRVNVPLPTAPPTLQTAPILRCSIRWMDSICSRGSQFLLTAPLM